MTSDIYIILIRSVYSNIYIYLFIFDQHTCRRVGRLQWSKMYMTDHESDRQECESPTSRDPN